MPELAEVEFFRKQWIPGLHEPVIRVFFNPQARVFRLLPDPATIIALQGSYLFASSSHGKAMRFVFQKVSVHVPNAQVSVPMAHVPNAQVSVPMAQAHLGIHLGMSGSLQVAAAECLPGPHDHLVLYTRRRALVFNDPRMFGAVRFAEGGELPPWWRDLPPQPQDPAFDRKRLQALVENHPRQPLKAFLLDQQGFPGIGNWMADEILWRARLHPGRLVKSLSSREISRLLKELKSVCSDALRVIGTHWGDPPEDWLFHHRWRDGGICPKSGNPLQRIKIGGRTTCFSPALQRWVDA